MMKRNSLVVFVVSATVVMLLAGCPKAVDERIRQSTELTPLTEAVHATDLSIKSAIESNIMSDPVLQYYAKQYGLTVEVSHFVATIRMKVKTKEQHDQVIELAKQVQKVRDITDEIEIDPNIEDPPFEW